MESQTIPETDRLYLMNSYLFDETATIKVIRTDERSSEQKKMVVYLDRTIFHPQGGGQPSDEGVIVLPSGLELKVVELLISKEHLGIGHVVETNEQIESELKNDIEVKLKIDEEKRRIYAKVHSAGHLLDIAVNQLGYQWAPGKGYHFPSGAYVEYQGPYDPKAQEQIVKSLNEACTKIIQEVAESDKTQINWIDYEEAKKTMDVPAFLPVGKPIRFIKLQENDKGCSCGGTHVQSIKDINSMTVRKINKKGKNVRVAYEVA